MAALREEIHAKDAQDRLYAGLRGAALVAGVAYAFVSLGPGRERSAVLDLFTLFLGYTLALYGGWSLLVRAAGKAGFYVIAAALDVGFVVALCGFTGGAASPFIRALYLWVAMLAFYFGRRGGLAASVVALGVFFAFHVRDQFPGDPWGVLAQAGGVLLHGPLIGFLTDRERQRARALEEAHARLATLNARLVDEQKKLIQTEKLSSIGLLAAGVAHEINNPLSGVLTCMKALRSGKLDATRATEYFDTVEDGLERIRVAVSGLLDYSRQRPPAPLPLDVADLVASCVRLVAPALRAKDIDTRSEIAQGEAQVVADRSQTMQAIVNVLMNAIYAVPRGGAIEVLAVQDGERTGIRIVDNGSGIPANVLDRVCDPFFTTKPEGEGTGLGLAVTIGVVRANGGDLEIASEVGKGTTVTLWLPAAKGALIHA